MRRSLAVVACLLAPGLVGCSGPTTACDDEGADQASEVCPWPSRRTWSSPTEMPAPAWTPRPTPLVTEGPWAVGRDGLPRTFPRDEVPVPAGEVSGSMTAEPGNFVFVVVVERDLAGTTAAIGSRLEDAGFAVEELARSPQHRETTGLYESERWWVAFTAQAGGVPRPRHQLPAGFTRVHFQVVRAG